MKMTLGGIVYEIDILFEERRYEHRRVDVLTEAGFLDTLQLLSLCPFLAVCT